MTDQANHARMQERRFERLAAHSLDIDARKKYVLKRIEWQNEFVSANAKLQGLTRRDKFEAKPLSRKKDQNKRVAVNAIRQKELTRKFRERGGVI